MIYLDIFLMFFKIGVFTFGGGHAMIPMIMDEVTTKGWMSQAELTQLIAVSESTPGPFAINIATFIGSTQQGIGGSLVATLGVVMPSFLIILLIASIFQIFKKNKTVNAVLRGITPVVIGLILAAGIEILLNNIVEVKTEKVFCFDYVQILLFLLLFGVYRAMGKKAHPIFLIILAGGLGVLIYSFYIPPIFQPI